MPQQYSDAGRDGPLGLDNRFALTLLFTSFGVLFVVDSMTPLGVADWIFYVVPVAVSMLFRAPSVPLVAAAIATALSVLGYAQSPVPTVISVGTDAANALTNRVFGIAVYWILALLGRAYAAQRLALHRTAWLQSSQTKLVDALHGELSVAQTCEAALQVLARCTGAVVGAAYTFVRPGELMRAAGYALTNPAPAQALAIGEGPVGEAAAQRRTVVIGHAPPDYLEVRSGTGRGAPVHVVVMPVMVDEAVLGVIELGFFVAPSAVIGELLSHLDEPLAIAIRSAEYRERLQKLLEQTQDQANELQVQQEELRVTNEELERQTRELLEAQGELERRQARLQATNADLEGQRSTALEARELLRQRAVELTTMNRYKSEFLTNMSHELRTPLNSALIMAQLLAENRLGNLTPEQIKYAQSIQSAGNDLLVLINDMLDLSRIEAGKIDLRVGTVTIASAVDSLRQMFGHLASSKGLAFVIDVDPTAPREIESDATRLSQILKNLLANAFKFTERGSVTLRVSGHEGGCMFSVQDTGIGIAADRLESIFDHFQQADGSISRRFGGTGLGLSISRQLATLLGGRIEVTSREHSGSTFLLWLPVGAPVAGVTPTGAGVPALDETASTLPPAPPSPPAPTVTPEPLAVQGRDEHCLLIVEDDGAFGTAVSLLARERGLVPLLAKTAAEATTLLQTRVIGGVVLDVRLPDGSGLAVLEELKRNPTTRHIPVHVLSAYDDGERALALGAIGFSRKPVGAEGIVAAFDALDARGRVGPRRVLVVEDDATQRNGIAELLRSDGVEIVGAGSVADARALLDGGGFDCVVLDLGLPDGDGVELLEQLADAPSAKKTPVVVYTARDLPAHQEARLRRGSSAIILKGPHSGERLLEEVTLFLHRVEDQLPALQREMLRAVRDRERVFEGRRILLAEDDVRNVFALTAVLEQRGARLTIARNGREAIDQLNADPTVDLVLMDVMMPELDGISAIREIRRDARFAKLPIVVLTAKAMGDDRDRCLDAGANDYLAKPVQVDKLLALLRVWLPR